MEERKQWTNNCEGVLGGENDRWKMIPKGQKGMESVAPNKVLGNCYFQIEFEAWIQHSKK